MKPFNTTIWQSQDQKNHTQHLTNAPISGLRRSEDGSEYYNTLCGLTIEKEDAGIVANPIFLADNLCSICLKLSGQRIEELLYE